MGIIEVNPARGLMTEEMVDEITLPVDATSLHFMQAIYRDSQQPMTRRMRAAQIAIAFEHPNLAVAVSLDSEGFAKRLADMMERNGLRTVIDAARPKAVEGDGNAGEAGFGFTGKRED